MEVLGSWGFGGDERLPALPSRGGGGEVIWFVARVVVV